MTARHTPGPWKYHVGRGANPRWHVQTTGGYQIASTPEISRHVPEAAEQEATARLIAAAPELLAALEEMDRAFRVPAGTNPQREMRALDGARAAISRAREAV